MQSTHSLATVEQVLRFLGYDLSGKGLGFANFLKLKKSIPMITNKAYMAFYQQYSELLPVMRVHVCNQSVAIVHFPTDFAPTIEQVAISVWQDLGIPNVVKLPR